MRSTLLKTAGVCAGLLMLTMIGSAHAGSRAVINADQVLIINGRKVFPIGFTLPPPPEGRTPEGRPALEELATAGATFLRTGPMGTNWTEQTCEREQKYLDAAARFGLYCMPFLREHASVGSLAAEEQLRDLVRRFKNHPGLGAWKGADEPEWGKLPLEPLLRAARVIKESDPDHPIVIIHAPRGTVESLRRYNATGDVLGGDIYPVGYPPGTHSLLTNKHISLVGDHTRILMEVAGGRKPVWMVLQIAWSGVVKPGRTLRFPTFPEERFMTYQAIINGARGLIYFGGSIEKAMTEADRELGWNWAFWRRVLRPVIEEIGSHSPLYPALVAPESTLPLKVTQAAGIEFCAREVGNELFVLACNRDVVTAQAEFSGLPPVAAEAEVMFEAPRTVEVKQGTFKDWFGSFEVHVYRFRRTPVGSANPRSG